MNDGYQLQMHYHIKRGNRVDTLTYTIVLDANIMTGWKLPFPKSYPFLCRDSCSWDR